MVEYVRYWFCALSLAKRIGIVAGAFTAMATAILTGANALSIAEPYWFTTRSFVRGAIADSETKTHKTISNQTKVLGSILGKQIEYQLRNERAERRQIESLIATKEALQLATTSEDLRAALNAELRRLREDLRETDAVINKLNRELEAGP